MREKHVFAERKKVFKSDKTKRKFFLVYEGSKTEDIYFEALNESREKVGISSLVELIPLIKSYSEEGWSNPKKLLDCIISNIEEERTGTISYESLINRIMAYLYDQKILTGNKIQSRAVWNILKEGCIDILERSLYEDVEDLKRDCQSLVEYLNQESDIISIVEDISDIIRLSNITYEEDFDKICLIVDRDKESFLALPENNQYEYVLQTCRNKKFGFYVTNPCFEFWLLLHYDKVFELDKDKLLENPKVTAKRRYTEQELRKLLPGYSKSSYNATVLMDKIQTAISNEEKFCEDPQKLVDMIGSNVAKLLKEIINGT